MSKLHCMACNGFHPENYCPKDLEAEVRRLRAENEALKDAREKFHGCAAYACGHLVKARADGHSMGCPICAELLAAYNRAEAAESELKKFREFNNYEATARKIASTALSRLAAPEKKPCGRCEGTGVIIDDCCDGKCSEAKPDQPCPDCPPSPGKADKTGGSNG